MNIRIPYDKLGNLKKYSFVSFILDANKESIFRNDYVNGKDKMFFNKELPYIFVPDDIYEKCDSIIFFPHLIEKNEWGSKLIMWKNADFIKMNAGYQFVRNAEKTPDIEKVKNWLDVGKSIPPSTKTVGEKNLIYFTLFHNDEYLELLKILLNSLKRQKFKKFDILFITDNYTKNKLCSIPSLNSFNVYYHIVSSIKDPVDASMQKLKIFEWDNINKYKNILFLDVDMVAIGNVGSIFNKKYVKNDMLYSGTHNYSQELHKTVYHTLIDYTEDQLRNFSKKGISAINAGQFFFKNTETMRSHFENINNFIKIWDGRYFFEQSFINYYFNLLELGDVTLFKDEFQFVSINENETEKHFGLNPVFVHFMGNACNGIGKLEFMNMHYSKYL